ncbi:PREDICTED: uncharacterized protein LOC109116199 [Tarenaya hassleriana]|nr:PREDICTED: uncharacterized protein LOC109116199 [Tarenaya hassleriana]
MAAAVYPGKTRAWQRCSKQIREQRARLYIIWRCTLLLLSWHDD